MNDTPKPDPEYGREDPRGLQRSLDDLGAAVVYMARTCPSLEALEKVKAIIQQKLDRAFMNQAWDLSADDHRQGGGYEQRMASSLEFERHLRDGMVAAQASMRQNAARLEAAVRDRDANAKQLQASLAESEKSLDATKVKYRDTAHALAVLTGLADERDLEITRLKQDLARATESRSLFD